MHRSRTFANWTTLAAGIASIACNSVIGLDDFSVGPGKECVSNQQCIERTRDSAGKTSPAVCLQPEGRCAELLTEHCPTVTGPFENDDSILIGSLFSITGPQKETNLRRQEAAMLAVEQINSVDGVPLEGETPRELVLVSCDEVADLDAASRHLVDNLGVPGIVGPNTSQDTINVSNAVTVPGDTVVMSPTAVASNIAGLTDNDLTWLMVPNDEQRAPLMIQQIQTLEVRLKEERGIERVKLGVVFRDDALGRGTRTSLNELVINGASIADPSNLNVNVDITGYKSGDANQDAIVTKYLEFQPDIVVLAGTAEAISQVMKPLEERWIDTDTPRPHYILIDSVKVPELIALAKGNSDLRHRVRGTGIKPTPESNAVYSNFKIAYNLAFPGKDSSISGMGPAYDATYAIAMALAATRGDAVSGSAIARGLRKLSGGTTKIRVGETDVTRAFSELSSGNNISVTGTFGPLAWDDDGAVIGGTIEMWCLGTAGDNAIYQSSGLEYDLMTGVASGTYKDCTPAP